MLREELEVVIHPNQSVEDMVVDLLVRLGIIMVFLEMVELN